MSRVAPSPQSLRHLRCLCTLDLPIATSAIQTRACRGPLRSPRIATTRIPRRALSTILTSKQEIYAQPETHSTSPHHTTSNTEPSPPDITNYYTLFPLTLPAGPPPSSSFSVSLPSLRREFLSLQSKFHPDKYPLGTPSHAKSLALSSLLNTAYRTLSDPLLRARYLLLENNGIDVTNEDNSLHGGLTDQGTLVEVMEAQEALEEASTHDEIETLIEENNERIRQTETVLGKAFENANVEEAKRECVRLNYWRSLQSALKEWEPGKEIRLVH